MNHHIIAENLKTGERFVLRSFWSFDDAIIKLDLLNDGLPIDFRFSVETFDIFTG